MNVQELNNNGTTKQDYELSFLLKESATQAAVLNILRKYQITPSYESSLNQIRLAYPIQRQTSAFFGFCHFSVEPAAIQKIKEELTLTPEILRFLIVASPVRPRAFERKSPAHPPEEKSPEPTPPVLTNEALEEKLEEILK